MTHSHCVREKNPRKGHGFESRPVHYNIVPFMRSRNMETEMKLAMEDFERVGQTAPLALFNQGIKAEETREKYTRTLRQGFCTIFGT